ncbi:MAG: hypothetical protein NZM29_09050 [Nitrospira sp.]|nr:hypothetical protein [Nitrospira sp.]
MKGSQPDNLSPSACFVVERVPSEGYQVTSAEGRYANEWKGRALALLDALGQPDPTGPAEYYRWVGPIAPSGEYVGVFVKLTPNGEARYHQAWFQAAKPMTRPMRSTGLLILLMIIIFAAGAFAGRMLFTPGVSTTSSSISANGLPGISKADPLTKVAPPDIRLTKLNHELASTRDVRAKLKGYLAQEGFAADTSTPVVDERRSVKLIADLDKTPPPLETIRLSNLEVAKLLRLLEMLDDWTINPKPVQKPEGR